MAEWMEGGLPQLGRWLVALGLAGLSGAGVAAPTVVLTSPADQSVITRGTTVTLSATASVDAGNSIDKVEFYDGTNRLNGDSSPPYSTTWNGSSGTHTLTAKVTDNKKASATSAPVTVVVANAPSVSLSSPATGAMFTAPAVITLTASASDTDGSVAMVEFYAGTSLVGTATAAPYSATWTAVPAGSYTLTAKATDNLGLSSTSSAVAVTVNAPPTVALTSPAANSVIAPNTSLTLTATAADADGTVSRVEFYVGTTRLNSDSTAPYSVNWKPSAAGTYTLSARATDNRGAVTTSAPITLFVGSAPTVSLTSPPANTVVNAPASLTLAASVADSDGTVAKVEFYQGSTLIGTAFSAPYSLPWANIAAGSYSLTAKVTDNQGIATTSAAVPVLVNALPTVVLSSPAANAVLAPNGPVTVMAAANDVDGSVTKVEIYVGATLLGTATTAPYAVAWSAMAPGSYTLTAKATDDRGASAVSAAVPVRVAVGGAVYYLHSDHLETPRLVMDSQGREVWRRQPLDEPFGLSPAETDPDGDGVAFELNLRFPGQYFDKETNLAYNYYRDYDPVTGRYRQSDPIGLQGGINTYSYVGGNPLSLIDPDGRKVVIVGHLAAGFIGRSTNPDSYHLAIYLDPDDKCECKGSWPMTLGAQPDFRRDGTTWLVRSINNLGDALSQASFTQQVTPPAGVSDCEFIKRLIAAAMAYGNNQRYSFPSIIPGFGRDGQMGAGDYNSNSFVSGTFNGAGFAAPQISGQGFQTPGYSNPVPMGR